MNLVHEPFIETFTKIVNMCLYYNSRGECQRVLSTSSFNIT